MARKNRIVLEGAIYHIYQRGNNREHIFENPKHKQFLVKQIREYNKIFDFQLLAYVIMDNHYHLLIKANKASVSEIMFNINNVLGKYIKKELNRTGHAFESRYKSKLVDNDAYIIWLLRYIHRNPVRANICANPDGYKWCSHHFYKNGRNEFVKTNIILKMLSEDKITAIKQYAKLINMEENRDDQELDFENVKKELNLNESVLSFENDEITKIPVRTLEEILCSLKLDMQSRELLRNGSKKRSITPYKIALIKEAISNKYTLKEIGAFLNTSQSAISNILSYYNIRL